MRKIKRSSGKSYGHEGMQFKTRKYKPCPSSIKTVSAHPKFGKGSTKSDFKVYLVPLWDLKMGYEASGTYVARCTMANVNRCARSPELLYGLRKMVEQGRAAHGTVHRLRLATVCGRENLFSYLECSKNREWLNEIGYTEIYPDVQKEKHWRNTLELKIFEKKR